MRLKRTDQSPEVKPRRGSRGWMVVLFYLFLHSPLAAQGPSSAWKTVETLHFRIHYPVVAEDWALRTASRLEAIRERVSHEVGFEPEVKADVLVMDPLARPNGSAIADLRHPRMVLWTTPPPPDSILGHYRDWAEILAVHEDVHLVHLLRPSRNRWQTILSRLLPAGPIAYKSPRWLIEGYATVIEGELTGYGRPNSDLRAAILRRKAQLGELPSYAELDGNSTWHGYRMAYLLGSAYLEWLRAREGPESLQHLWRRLSAVRERDFESAFQGVFGDRPERLYNRFCAELTYSALKVEKELEGSLAIGELWQDLSWNTGRPDVSPEGDRMVLVLRSRDRPARLVVWRTEEDPEAEKRWQEDAKRLIEKDPLDVPAVRRRPLPLESIHELPGHHGGAPHMPRFMPDGRSILFVRFEPDGAGFLHPDLFRWWPQEGRVERLTRGADLRDPDPSPDGRHAVAVRHRNGASQLIRVELATGRVEPLSPPSVERVYAQPRFHPNGRHLAFVRQEQDGWRLVVRDLSSGLERRLPTPARALVAHPAWSADGGALFASIGERGRIDLHAFPFSEVARGFDGEAQLMTQSLGAALAPEPTPDGRELFFLSLEADGLDLRRIELKPRHRREIETRQALHPILTLPTPEPDPPFPQAELDTPKPYGVGRLEKQWLLAGSYGPGGRSRSIALRGGDVLGRSSYLLSWADAEGVFEGGALAARWRGWPIELGAHLFVGKEEPSRQPNTVSDLNLDMRRKGLELRSGWRTETRRLRFAVEGGLALEERDTMPSAPEANLDRRLLFIDARQSSRHRWGPWTLSQNLALETQAGETGGKGWNLSSARLRLAGGYEGSTLGLSISHRRVRGTVLDQDRLQLGGFQDAQIPASLQANRLFAPALPRGVGIGDDFWFYRADLRLFDGPVWLFHERYELEDSWLELDAIHLRGIELRWTSALMPLFGLPGIDFHLGLAEVLDPPFENEIEGWIRLSFHP